jgi:hypothetical protein
MEKWEFKNLCLAILVVCTVNGLYRHAISSSRVEPPISTKIILDTSKNTLDNEEEYDFGISLGELLKKCQDNFQIVNYSDTENIAKLRKTGDKVYAGDLIFQVAINSEFENAVAQSGTNNDSATHVGIFCPPDIVIEANDYGVVGTGICEFLKSADENKNILVRIEDRTIVKLAVERAKNFLGQPYNESFSPETGKGLYCSQLITESYLKVDGSRYFKLWPMRFDDREFWEGYFNDLNVPIPDGVLGSHPQQILDQKTLLYRVFEIRHK